MELWLSAIDEGRYEAAWAIIAEKYSRLILATIRHLVRDEDDAMDVFSDVCVALSEKDLERIRQFVADPHRAKFSTWLVVVVRNLTIDWLRKNYRRPRHIVPATLSGLQREVYEAVFLEGNSHVEAYEIIASRHGSLDFRAFLRALRDAYRHKANVFDGGHHEGGLSNEFIAPATDAVANSETARRLADALATFPPANRLALELFVIDGMSATQVAKAVGWRNAKAVYNNVYRMLEALRVMLERAGVTSEDLP
ncbi:MAG TPA: sigma-70 family RNA polymerase sigma factor [Gemmatimonadaceae bacterium]|nr:sigma-70 family RNA polymerase sigma factor [Gemmatimonadaceae bacterium]